MDDSFAAGTANQADAIRATAGQSEPETRVLRFRSHASRLVWSALVLILVTGAAFFYVGSFAEEWENLAAVAGAVVAVLLFVIVPYFRWLTRTTQFTTRRVIVRSGFFTRHRREILLVRIRETKLKQGLLQRLWGAGDLVFVTGIDERIVIHNVPRVTDVAEILQELVERQFTAQQVFTGSQRR